MTIRYGLHPNFEYLEPNLVAFLNCDRNETLGGLYTPNLVLYPGGQVLDGTPSNTAVAAMPGRVSPKKSLQTYGGYTSPVTNNVLNPCGYGAGNVASLGAASILLRCMANLTYPGVSLGLYEQEKYCCGSDIWHQSS